MSLTQSQWDAQRREAKAKAAEQFEASKREAVARLVEERGIAKAAELAGLKAVQAAQAPVEVDVASQDDQGSVEDEIQGQAPATGEGTGEAPATPAE